MEEEDIQIDFSEWTVVDEDVGDSGDLSRKTNTNTKTENTRRLTNVKEPVKNANPKSVSKPQNSSAATSAKNQSSKENSNKTNVASKSVAKPTTSSGANNAGRNVVSSSTSEVSKNVVESVTCTRTSDSGKNKVESTSEKAAPSSVSRESCNKSPQGSKTTNISTTHSQHGTTEVSCVETVQVTSLKDTPGGSRPDIASISGSTATKSGTVTAAVTQVTSSSTSAALKEGKSEAASMPLSTNTTAKAVAATSNMTPTASTVSSSNQSTSQATSSRTLVKSNTKNKVRNVESIAEIMAAVGKEDARTVHCDVGGMEDVSDTELADTTDLTKSKSKVAGMKRDASPNKGGPPIKKTKSSAVLTQVSSAPAARDQPVKKDQDNGNQNQKNPKQQTQGNKTEDTLKPSPRNQLPGGMSSTPKGSFGSAKTLVTKIKTPPAVSPITVKTPTASAAPKTTDIENKPSTTTSTTVKRIIRRFHRMTQTAITERSNKLVHCLIKVPSLDAPPKPNCHSEVQVSIEKETKDEVFYQRALPETVKPEIFKVVSTFNLNDTGSRNIIITGSYGYGISLGHVTAADVEKSTFRENLLAKSACYRLYLDKQDFGVVDLFFGEEDHFVTVLTQIRKMRMGPRHLVVTYYKNLKETERDPVSPVSSVKATIIYNQNFATTNFLAHTKAPLWNKPKVEEILTIHNMPEGIPLDFLKTIIPDAITVEMEDKNQKFTQKGRRVRLGLDRKNGGDSFLKLFAQMYVNNECLAFSVLYTPLSAVPELTDILKEKKKRESDMHKRELKAVPRDISATPYVGETEKVDVVMQVDTVVKDVLSYLTPAKTGPSTVQKLQQPVCPPVSNKPPTVKESVKDSVLSDVSNEFSDISEASNIGEAGVSKVSQKNSSVQRKPTSMLKRTSRIQHKVSSPREKTEKTFSRREPLTGVGRSTFRKTYVSSRINDRRKEIRDRYLDKDRKSSLSKPADFVESVQRIRGIRSVRPERHDIRRGPPDRVSRISNSDRGRERPTHRQNTSENRVRDEPEPIRDRIPRDKPRVDIPRRDSFDRLSSSRDHGRNAEDRGGRGHTANRTERIRHKSEEKDNRRVRVSSTTDRHGNKIVGLHLREGTRKATGTFQDNVTEEFSDDRVDQVAYNEREIRRGNKLDLLVQKRLHSLEKEEKEVNDSREVILTRSRSPITRRNHRGRTTSPRRYQPASVTPGRMRQASPVYGNQQRFNAGRRSRSPRPAANNPVLSPISAGEDEAGDSLEGMWLPQPPATLISQQDTRKSSLSARSSNYVKPQAEWKSQGSPDQAEKESYNESQSKKFIEQFVEQVIGTSSSEKHSPKPFNDPAKVIEKIREIYNSTVNVHENVSDNEDDGILHSAVPRGGQNRSRPGERVGPVASRNTVRASSNISSNSSHGAEPKPVDHFERRDNYERNKRGAGDSERFDDSVNNRKFDASVNNRKFDAPVNNRSRAFDREAGTTALQKNSGGYAESRVLNQPNTSRFRGKGILKNSTTEEYQDTGMQDQSNYGQYRESENSNWPNSGGYSEFGMANSGGYRESEAPFRQNSGGYRESEAPFRQNSGGFRESEAPFRQNTGGYRDSDTQNHPGFGAYHPNQPLQSPIPPPVIPPLHHNAMKSAQEKFAELESMANMVAAEMEHHHGLDNFGQGMWNEGPQQDPTPGPQQYNTGPQQYSAGPQQYPPGPQFNFPGPQAAHGPNMNFSGPRHPPTQPPNNHQPFLRGANPQPAPWHHNNFF